MGLDKASLDKLKRAVAYTQQAHRSAPKLQPRPTTYPEPQIWAEITGLDEAGKYSWEMLEFTGTTWQTSTELLGLYSDDTGYAVEIHGCTHVLKGSRVLLWTLGYEPVLAFDYDGKQVFGTSSGTITARSGGTPGSGNVNVVVRDGSTQTVPVKNRYATAIDTNTVVHIGIDWQGYWSLLGADCEA